MSRPVVLLPLLGLVALAVILTILKSTGGTPKASGPANRAVVSGAAGQVDVWRDSRGRLTFHHVGDDKGDVDRYDPRTQTMDSIVGGALADTESGTPPAEAWGDVYAWYGVEKTAVLKALGSGEPSPGAFRLPHFRVSARLEM